MRIEIAGLTSIPEVASGDDLGRLIREAALAEGEAIDASTLVAVAQKVVSKAEGAVVDLREIQPSALARSWAAQWDKDPRLVELILSQSRRIVKMDQGLLIAETRHGFVCANAGVDQSNAGGEHLVTVLPADPDASARRLLASIGCGAVIVTDTFGRPWRQGLVDVALGSAGFIPLDDCRGTLDRHGRSLSSTILAVADQVAAAAGLAMGKSDGCPAVLVRGFQWRPGGGSASELVRPAVQDLFR